ncbi:PIG-L deacetylase family protein [Thalassotalea sp. 1_MG-2023]|uniref:PIG-L deacetylase family protein n=1 Tax=Thalassotalea sp. 1_MG-2023 TaxID=3062680 RepID=UPI0026E3CD8C|nr:PIG-L deacetylase family protein [Thalassotalea sp. 1_MG-2023]MDO6426451.1 PIG-L deacetylase family protein [Thalassotalea sp. 1_MG-2023]
MSRKILVVAPHPDDETLGCGGTLLKHKAQGDTIHWLIVTKMTDKLGYSNQQITNREKEIKQVADAYDFDSINQLSWPPAGLDNIPTGELVGSISTIMQNIKPNIIYLPYKYDVHSDHKYCFDASVSASKSFRAPFIQSIRVYETLSETDFNLDPNHVFTPNLWIDITGYLEKKIEITNHYQSEFGLFPFPRSEETLTALAQLRGAQINSHAAESFMLLKEIQ